MDGNGNVYIADTENNCIYKYDSAGNLLLRWYLPIKTTRLLSIYFSLSIAVDSKNHIHVADPARQGIYKYDTLGNLLTQGGEFGKANGQLIRLLGIAVDSHGSTYIAYTDNNRIQ